MVTLLALFPRVDRLPITLERVLNPDALINPDSPALEEWVIEFDEQRQASWDRKKQMKEIEKFVYRKITYAWDWEQWSNVEYFPTVEEAVASGREDCDGRAVVAASLLKRYGYDAKLATDFTHVWVVTDAGETMSPGKKKAIAMTEQGTKIDWSFVWDLPRTLSFGISVFPLGRELILALVIWMLMIGRNVRLKEAFVYLLLMVIALMLLREGGRPREPHVSIQWWGYVVLLATMIRFAIRGKRARPSQ